MYAACVKAGVLLSVAAVAMFGLVPAAIACEHSQPPRYHHHGGQYPPAQGTPPTSQPSNPQPAPPAPPSATQSQPGPVTSSSSSTATASPVVTIAQNVVNVITVTVVEKVPGAKPKHHKAPCGCKHKAPKKPRKPKVCKAGTAVYVCTGPKPPIGGGLG